MHVYATLRQIKFHFTQNCSHAFRLDNGWWVEASGTTAIHAERLVYNYLWRANATAISH